jgi:hypothetical protein
MEPRVTHAFNISEIIHSSLPDSEGNIIPAAIQSGSAEIAGLGGEQQHILVNMDAAVYNVKKAICGTGCIVCNGVVNSFIVADPFGVTIGGAPQETFYMQYNTGTQYNLNGHSSWSSSNTGQATVSFGLVTGVSAGSPQISAQDLDFEPIYNSCATSRTSCTAKTNAFRPSGSTRGTVRVPTLVRWINTVESGAAVCPTGQAGFSRQVTLELDDQNGQAMAFSGITMADSIQNSATNQLGLGNPQTGSFPTNAAGQWPDQYYACSTVCPTSTGETDALQYWTANGSPLPHVNSLVYKCNSNTIDGK